MHELNLKLSEKTLMFYLCTRIEVLGKRKREREKKESATCNNCKNCLFKITNLTLYQQYLLSKKNR